MVLFIRKAGRYTSASLLSKRFRWRVKQLRAGWSGLLLNWLKDLCFSHNIYFFRFVELRPSFTANPPDPFDVLEGNNITFVWQYNLDGTFHSVALRFIGSSLSRTILYKFDINLDAVVPQSFYQGRIQENINATRSEITIFALQRSESGEYEIEVIDKTFDPARDKMTVQVQCE